MRAYVIYPPFKTTKVKTQQASDSIDLIAEIVLQSLRTGGDTFQFSVIWANPGSGIGTSFDDDIAIPHVFKLDTEEKLRSWLKESIDSYVVGGGDIRSIATCRAATFGYDGQALLLLRSEDQPPSSPDQELAVVAERPDFLTSADWFDGWVREAK